jgi:hypothetical protein
MKLMSIGHGDRDCMIRELRLWYESITQSSIKILLNV